jgi:hypothetical protein
VSDDDTDVEDGYEIDDPPQSLDALYTILTDAQAKLAKQGRLG